MDKEKKVECYQCGTPVYELSLRSRCVNCEHGRGDFNEAENDRLREAAFNVVDKRGKMPLQSQYTLYGYCEAVNTAIDNLKGVLEN